MNFNSIHSVCILGAGTEGRSVVEFLQHTYPHLHITLADTNTDAVNVSGVEMRYGNAYPTSLESWDCVVVSPGIPPSTPLLATARAITTGTNIFFEQCVGKIIAVTASKGKSTTSTLIAHILHTAGHPATVVGNIGTPALHALLNVNTSDHTYVYELSSYQASRLSHGPDVAVVLNLFPEHMNYHGSLEQYYKDKMNITTLQTAEQVVVYNTENLELVRRINSSVAQKISYPQTHGYHIGEDGIYQDSICIATFQELPLKGLHNASNVVAALTAASTICSIDLLKARTALLSFTPLPHRLHIIGYAEDITWVDDAISTTPESTLAALAAFPHTGAIILGGLDRGYDFSALATEIAQRKIPVLVFFPDSGRTIERAIQQAGWTAPHTLHTTSMQEAVEYIAMHCTKRTAALLSCASPSYSLFKNFEDKGDKFKTAVFFLEDPWKRT